jgi:hypothetical protein
MRRDKRYTYKGWHVIVYHSDNSPAGTRRGWHAVASKKGRAPIRTTAYSEKLAAIGAIEHKIGNSRVRRSGARENPDTGVWLAIGAGVVVLGGVVYFLTRPAVGPTNGPNAPSPDQLPQQTQNKTLHVGQTLNIQFPTPPAGITGWGIPPADKTGPEWQDPSRNILSDVNGNLVGAHPGVIDLRFSGIWDDTQFPAGPPSGVPVYAVHVTVVP